MKIKKLATEFNKFGFTYNQIKRSGNVAIFEQIKDDKILAYEVVVIRAHEGYEIAGNVMEPAEFMPRSEDWGTFGWTLTNESDAHKRFNEVLKQDWTYLVTGPNSVQPAGKPRKRGRRRVDFEIKFPEGEFSMQELGEFNGKSSAYVYSYMKSRNLFGKIEEVREVRGGRGKPKKIYKAV